MQPIYPPASYRRHAGYSAYPTSSAYGRDERYGFFLPFVAGLVVGPLLAGGGYGGYGAPPPGSYGPQYGPSYGPNYGPQYGPNFAGPPGYGGYPRPRPSYGSYYGSAVDYPPR